MKKAIFLIVIVLSGISVFAQRTTKKISISKVDITAVEPNTLIENEFLDKYTGTWIWQSGNKKLVMQFIKIDVPLNKSSNDGVNLQLLKGSYQYYVNGVLAKLDTNKYNFIGSTDSDRAPVQFELRTPQKVFESTGLELNYLNANSLSLKVSPKAEYSRHRVRQTLNLRLKC
jgi:hypothetical protein